MTREEAVKRIKEIQKLYVFTPTINEALDLAIEALQETQGERMTRIVHELSGWDAESATTTEEGDGYFDDDYTVRDETQDNGFCHLGERENNE